MKDQHASKLSVFQILDGLWEMDQKESESQRDYGIRLDDKATEVKNIIVAKYETWVKKSSSSNVDQEKMTFDDIIKLVSGQVFLQNLKNGKQNIYNKE